MFKNYLITAIRNLQKNKVFVKLENGKLEKWKMENRK